MCGICGMVDFGGLVNDRRGVLESMVQTLRHRGPDQSGTWSDRYAALGHSRLSIIDLSDGRQPMSNEGGTIWITYNGEVYNFQPLREELLAKGHRFKTRTDTEVIVHLYEEEGIDCVRRLTGMFAFGLWDATRRKMFLARDQIGIKPLYYTVAGGRLIFGSEIKAILAHGGIERQVRPDALSDYLTFLYVPAPKTMFKDIFKLPAGHWLSFDSAGSRCQQYWDLEPAAPSQAQSPQIQGELIDRLAASVRRQMVSDVPLGAFLSGGVDSSAVVAMMQKTGAASIVTTSVGFKEARYNELPYARQVARRYHTEHFEEIVEPEAVSVVEKLAWHYDEPFADYSAIPTYYVSLAARRHVTVALSGDGGDENFAGYRRYRFDLLERRIRRWLPAFVQHRLLGPAARAYPKFDWLPRTLRAKSMLGNLSVDAPEAYCRSVGFLDHSQKLAILSDDVTSQMNGYRSADLVRQFMGRGGRSDLDQLLYTDIKTWLVDDILTKVDRASMAVSLEVRVPLLDHTFVQFAHDVPARLKVSGGQGKVVFKSALRPYLDDNVLYRPKQGFTPPIREWLRGPLAPMIEGLLFAGDPFYADYLAPGAVRAAWQTHKSGLRDNTPLVWAILMFELWGRQFMRGSHGPSR